MTVIIPVAGDDHAPQLDKAAYEVNIVSDGSNGWTLDPANLIISAADEDMLVENRCNFLLVDILDAGIVL